MSVPEIPEGIFDMVRAVCIVASVSAFLDTVRVASRGLFEDPCPTCLGNGRMTCDRCQGTKTLTNRPARFMAKGPHNSARFLRRQEDASECWQCGPYTRYDFDLNTESINDSIEATVIRKNFVAALAGKRIPLEFQCSAGMVLCKTCMGSRKASRFVPNFARLFGQTPSLFHEYARRDGIQTYVGSNTALFKPRRVTAFQEYREHPPTPTFQEVFQPVVHVHAILCPGIRKGMDYETLDPDDFPSPFKFRLPGLDGTNVAAAARKPIGHPLAFP